MSAGTTKDAVATYVQERLRAETPGWGDAAKIARATKVSTAHISNAKNYGTIGQEFAEKMAKYWGMTYDELVRVATGKASPPEAPQPIVFVPDDRYDNRVAAIKFAEIDGVDPQAVDAIRSVQLDADEDPSAQWWLEQLRAMEARLRFTRKTPGAAERQLETNAARMAQDIDEEERAMAEAKARRLAKQGGGV